MNAQKLLETALEAARLASHEIMKVYNMDSHALQADKKADNSPLTLADRNAHEAIVACLNTTGIPVVSEEGKDIPYAVRCTWEYLWMVDPLDGTKEFLNRNGEFTVNIALVHNGQPVLGVVAVPESGEVYYGGKETGAYVIRAGRTIALSPRSRADLQAKGIRVVASRSHLNHETTSFIESLNNPQLVSKGSSLKFMLVAEGKADVYPRYAPTMEWDTAAAHAVVQGVGLKVMEKNTGMELRYNKPDLINPHFICF